MKKQIFEFNQIDNLLSEDEIKTIKEFYEYYHKKFWCFKKIYKHFKVLDESINISGILLMIIGTISGGLTMNPIILGVINGVGIVLTNFGKMKNDKKKIEMTKIAYFIFLYLVLNKMIKTIIDYVNYHYQLCENIDSFY